MVETMKTIRVKFVDFWGDFNPKDNFILDSLRKKYDVQLADDPDYLFFSSFGFDNLKYDCVKISFIGENYVPDFNNCDYGIGFDWLTFGDRYFRFPLYKIYESYENFIAPYLTSSSDHESAPCLSPSKLNSPLDIALAMTDEERERLLDRKFCSIVVSNIIHANPIRERFFRLLSEYKQVDSGGRAWNNIGGPVGNKYEFISGYKFNISFENSQVIGYTTEKVMEPMTVRSVPIYWGNPEVGRDFNEKTIVNLHQFSSLESAVEHIVRLDNDPDAYLQYLQQPYLNKTSVRDPHDELLDFLTNILDKPLEEARYLTPYGNQPLHRQNLKVAGAIMGNGGLTISRILNRIKHRFAKN